MSVMTVESIEDWNDILHLLIDAGYGLWQTQFGVESPEGLHARFTSPGRPVVEIVTHSKAVHDAILAFSSL